MNVTEHGEQVESQTFLLINLARYGDMVTMMVWCDVEYGIATVHIWSEGHWW